MPAGVGGFNFTECVSIRFHLRRSRRFHREQSERFHFTINSNQSTHKERALCTPFLFCFTDEEPAISFYGVPDKLKNLAGEGGTAERVRAAGANDTQPVTTRFESCQAGQSKPPVELVV